MFPVHLELGSTGLDGHGESSYFVLMADRWKNDRPMSRAEFERRFPDEAACARYLAEKRWPEGFVCPSCDGCKGWELQSKPFTWECASCGRQTSVTAGTVMHRSKLDLKTWFTAIHLEASHSNGISALQLQAQLGLGSYETAWSLLHKIRRAMVDPGRSLLQDLVEVDDAAIVYRTQHDPIDGRQGRSPAGKLLIVGAVELSPDEERRPRRIRLQPIADVSGEVLHRFVDQVVQPGATVITDGLHSYGRMPNHERERHVIGRVKAHLVLPWVHRVFSNLKRWLMGTFHGARKAHFKRYLDEFTFRWNRRRHLKSAFDTLLRLAVRLPHASTRDFIEQRV